MKKLGNEVEKIVEKAETPMEDMTDESFIQLLKAGLARVIKESTNQELIVDAIKAGASLVTANSKTKKKEEKRGFFDE